MNTFYFYFQNRDIKAINIHNRKGIHIISPSPLRTHNIRCMLELKYIAWYREQRCVWVDRANRTREPHTCSASFTISDRCVCVPFVSSIPTWNTLNPKGTWRLLKTWKETMEIENHQPHTIKSIIQVCNLEMSACRVTLYYSSQWLSLIVRKTSTLHATHMHDRRESTCGLREDEDWATQVILCSKDWLDRLEVKNIPLGVIIWKQKNNGNIVYFPSAKI